MPKGTKVDRCFQKVRKKRGDKSAARICQVSTGQVLRTGKPRKKSGWKRKKDDDS